MNKKIFSAAFVLVGALVLTGAGCSQSTVVQNVSTPTTPGAGVETKKPESEQPIPKTTGHVPEAQCIDVLAHQLWAVQLQSIKGLEASINMVKKAENLQKQYGISDEDFENICNAKIGDVDFMDKIQKRMQELGFTIK